MNETRGVMIFAEQTGGTVHPVANELLGKGRQIADALGVELSAVLCGHCMEQEAHELIYRGADRVYLFDHEALDSFDIMNYRANIVALVEETKPDIFLLGATPIGRSLGPRLAAALGTGLTADCTSLEVDDEGHLVQIRPAFSGNILAHIKTETRPQMATVRYKIMQALPRDCERQGTVVRPNIVIDEPLEHLSRCFEKRNGHQAADQKQISQPSGKGFLPLGSLVFQKMRHGMKIIVSEGPEGIRRPCDLLEFTAAHGSW